MEPRLPASVIETLSDLIKFVEDHCSCFEYVIFRGQAMDWPLLPKIARLTFRDDISAAEAEKRMLNHLKKRSIPFVNADNRHDWDWLAIAQHHGMATRLLDWSTNPLAALWFTVEKPPLNGDYGVLWVFVPTLEDYVSDYENVSPFISSRTLVFEPRHVNNRIVIQNSIFTVHHFVNNIKFAKFENIKRYKSQLMKLKIPSERFKNLRMELDRCGINASTIYGDLVGLCKDIEWKHSLLEDENVD